MSNWLSLPILALAAVLQATFMPQIRVLGGMPELVFLCVVAWSVNATLETGVLWAFVGGILNDLMSAAPTGTSVLGLVVVVFGVNQLSRQVYGLGFIAFVGVIIVGTLVQQATLMAVLALSGFTVRPIENLTYIILPTIAYNVLFVGPVYWLLRRTQRRLTRDQVTT